MNTQHPKILSTMEECNRTLQQYTIKLLLWTIEEFWSDTAQTATILQNFGVKTRHHNSTLPILQEGKNIYFVWISKIWWNTCCGKTCCYYKHDSELWKTLYLAGIEWSLTVLFPHVICYWILTYPNCGQKRSDLSGYMI